MHPHRIDVVSCDAASRFRRSCSAGGENDSEYLHSPRVVGLGAPLSVLIRPTNCEIPLLAEEVRAALAEHDRHRPPDETPAGDWWLEERGVWETMLAGLDAPTEREIELVWPTPYAHEVLFGALCRVLARLERPSTRVEARGLGEALETACACFATWQAFTAIDHGGLQDVRL